MPTIIVPHRYPAKKGADEPDEAIVDSAATGPARLMYAINDLIKQSDILEKGVSVTGIMGHDDGITIFVSSSDAAELLGICFEVGAPMAVMVSVNGNEIRMTCTDKSKKLKTIKEAVAEKILSGMPMIQETSGVYEGFTPETLALDVPNPGELVPAIKHTSLEG